MDLTRFVLFVNIYLFCTLPSFEDSAALKITSIKPGRTPGVATPGDKSYMSELCMRKPGKLLNQELTHDPGSNSRKILSFLKRPAAWKAPHMNSDDLDKIKSLVTYYANSSKICTFLSTPCLEEGHEYSVRYNRVFARKAYSNQDLLAFPYIESG